MLYQILKYQNYFVTTLFKLVSFQIQLLCRIKGLPGSVQNKEVIGKCMTENTMQMGGNRVCFIMSFNKYRKIRGKVDTN